MASESKSSGRPSNPAEPPQHLAPEEAQAQAELKEVIGIRPNGQAIGFCQALRVCSTRKLLPLRLPWERKRERKQAVAISPRMLRTRRLFTSM